MPLMLMQPVVLATCIFILLTMVTQVISAPLHITLVEHMMHPRVNGLAHKGCRAIAPILVLDMAVL